MFENQYLGKIQDRKALDRGDSLSPGYTRRAYLLDYIEIRQLFYNLLLCLRGFIINRLFIERRNADRSTDAEE